MAPLLCLHCMPNTEAEEVLGGLGNQNPYTQDTARNVKRDISNQHCVLYLYILPCRVPGKPPILTGFLTTGLHTDCKISFVLLVSIKILVWGLQNQGGSFIFQPRRVQSNIQTSSIAFSTFPKRSLARLSNGKYNMLPWHFSVHSFFQFSDRYLHGT